jgi:phage antirepressor YoqD-like protein
MNIQDLTVKQVNFNGDNLLAVKDNATGKIHVAVYFVCKGLKLDENQTKVQRDKINSDIVLSKGGRKISIPTNGGVQDVLCIELEFLPLWLAKINVNIIDNPEIQDKLIEYQLKAKDVLAAEFLGQAVKLPATYSEALRELADKVDENLQLKAKVTELTPAADLGNAMRNNDGLIIIRDFVKVLANVGIKIRQCDLFSWLVKEEYLYQDTRGDYHPRVGYVHSGLFKVAETPVETHTNGSFISYTTRLTAKGQEYFINKLKGEFPCQLQ